MTVEARKARTGADRARLSEFTTVRSSRALVLGAVLTVVAGFAKDLGHSDLSGDVWGDWIFCFSSKFSTIGRVNSIEDAIITIDIDGIVTNVHWSLYNRSWRTVHI